MKIIGIGIDLVENKRFKLLNNKKFLERIFTKNEIMFSKNNKTNYYKRFVTKEAFQNLLV